MDFAGRIHNKLRGKNVCGRFRSKHAHGQQERLEQSRNGDREDIEKSDDVVVTANGEVLAKEEATECVRELDLFVTVMLFESTPAVLSPGKLCNLGTVTMGPVTRNHVSSKNGKKIHCHTLNHVPFAVPVLSTSSSTSSTSPTP